MALAPWSSPLPGFPPNQVTEFHLEGKCFFATLCYLCVMSTVTFRQTKTLGTVSGRHLCASRNLRKNMKLEHYWKFWDVQTQFHKEMSFRVKTPPQEEFP